MGSFNDGKGEVVQWIRENFRRGETCLDVGACNGKWSKLLDSHLNIDAVEAWERNIEKYNLYWKYRRVFNADIREFEYAHYDLIIFGDVLEHMSVEDAQKVIEYAYPRCRDMIIAVPYCYPQDDRDGNPYEVHVQDDLTPENFMERYKGLRVLWKNDRYGYYVKETV